MNWPPPEGTAGCEVCVESEELLLLPPEARADAGRAAAGLPVRHGLVLELHLVGLVGAPVLNVLTEHVRDKRFGKKGVPFVVGVGGGGGHVLLTEDPLAVVVELIEQSALLAAQAVPSTKNPLVRLNVDAKHKLGGHAVVQGDVVKCEPPPPALLMRSNTCPSVLTSKTCPFWHTSRGHHWQTLLHLCGLSGRLSPACRDSPEAHPRRLDIAQAVEASKIKDDHSLHVEIHNSDSPVQVGEGVILVPSLRLRLLGGRSSPTPGCCCIKVAPITLAPGLIAAGREGLAPHCAGAGLCVLVGTSS
mmetsp:Transcript_31496/g.77197  ORF Transcript_31496/g.77197 Transcript_31496/m.77197 type:complete len:303 (+) Transcript_31496:914-1822(+)